MAIHYYVLDTETTGLSPGENEVFQISVIRYSDNFQITRNIKVQFPERASKRALAVTKRSRKDLELGVSRKEALSYITEFFEEDGLAPEARCVVAHNAPFDKRFCHAEWGAIDQTFPCDLWLDTLDFCKKFANTQAFDKMAALQGTPDTQKLKFKLEYCLKILEVPELPGAHSATIDTMNTRNLFAALMATKLDHLKFITNEPHRLAKNNYIDTVDVLDDV